SPADRDPGDRRRRVGSRLDLPLELADDVLGGAGAEDRVGAAEVGQGRRGDEELGRARVGAAVVGQGQGAGAVELYPRRDLVLEAKARARGAAFAALDELALDRPVPREPVIVGRGDPGPVRGLLEGSEPAGEADE